MTPERCLLPRGYKSPMPRFDHQTIFGNADAGPLVASWRSTDKTEKTVGISGDSMLQLRDRVWLRISELPLQLFARHFHLFVIAKIRKYPPWGRVFH